MPSTDVPNFAQIAGFYSQLAGVLAGFAFAGLVALIASQLSKENSASQVLSSYIPLIVSFVGLIGASLNYAMIAGEGAPTMRSTTLEVTAGTGFAASFLMLLYSLMILIDRIRFDSPDSREPVEKSVKTLRRLTVFALCPITILLIYGAIRDFMRIKLGDGHSASDVEIVVPVIGAVFVIWIALLARYFPRRPGQTGKFSEALAISSIVITILAVTTSSLILSFFPSDAEQSDLIPLVSIGVYVGFVCFYSYCASRIGIESDSPPLATSTDASDEVEIRPEVSSEACPEMEKQGG